MGAFMTATPKHIVIDQNNVLCVVNMSTDTTI